MQCIHSSGEDSAFRLASLWLCAVLKFVSPCISSTVGRGRASRSDHEPTALLPPRSNGKTRGCYCTCWAPGDGREDAWNMLNCT